MSLIGTGSGQVTGPNITCGGGAADCSETYAAGTVVTLNAAPAGGSFFAGWSGSCTGTGACTVTMSQARAVTAKFDALPVLTVGLAGTGTGTVTGTGISCPGDCTESYAVNTNVTLTATATGGSTFAGWGASAPASCLGAPAPTTCTVTMDVSKTVTARFDPPAVLTVTKTGTGTGSVTGPGINCSPDCTEPYPTGTLVTLTASPTGGSTFSAWSGAVPAACTTRVPPTTCTVTMDASKTVTAQFDAVFTLTVTLTSSSFGAGTVTSDDGQINCSVNGSTTPQTCTGTYPSGASVTLTATETFGFFAGWSGDCAPPAVAASAAVAALPTCTLTMIANKNVGASFSNIGFQSAPRAHETAARPMTWATQLDVPEAGGQVVVNGRATVLARAGRSAVSSEHASGTNRVEAVLSRAGGRAGTWRFELTGVSGLQPGSIRPLLGTVIQITADAVVFRMEGRQGERVGFTFEVEP